MNSPYFFDNVPPVRGDREQVKPMNTHNGGPAFPIVTGYGIRIDASEGMSFLDYCAVHSTQPGMCELAKVAGLGFDASHRVYTGADDKVGMKFDDWWVSLSLDLQCELCGLVRYAQARGMLKARQQ